MARKKKTNINKYLISIVLGIIASIAYNSTFYLSDISLDKHETYEMKQNMLEGEYVKQWCTPNIGKREFVLIDNTRVDCLTKEYAIEFDFAKKWAESVGQAMYYGKMTNKKPAVAIIKKSPLDEKYIQRIKKINPDLKIFVINAY